MFGVTGDLSRKKLMPAIYDLANRGLLPPGFALVGFARRDWADEDFAEEVAPGGQGARPHPVPRGGLAPAVRGLPLRLRRVRRRRGVRRLQETIDKLDAERGTNGNHAFYLSVPPKFFPGVVEQLHEVGLDQGPEGSWRRVVIEKPFGHDLASAQGAQRDRRRRCSRPKSVFRIDHYLGKETVQNILALRFANEMFEPIWNRDHVDHVQITMAEDIGIGGRAGYYDGIGAARDVIQNHLLQLLALTAMEEPVSFDADALRRREGQGPVGGRACRTTWRVQHGARPVHGRVAGRREGASATWRRTASRRTPSPRPTPRSSCEVNTRRWAGVPFYLRTGKRLGRRVTEIAVVFKRAPHLPFDPDDDRGARAERAGHPGPAGRGRDACASAPRSRAPAMEVRDVNMDFAYGEAFTESSPEAYERLLLDVLLGDAPLFPRVEEVELGWEILDPIEEHWAKNGKPERYTAGTWGPAKADEMLAKDGRSWRRP